MCYCLFKHCAKLHEFNLSFSNNYFTFACEIGSQQPLIARMSRMPNHRSFTVKPKYSKLHIYMCYYFFKRCAKLHQLILTIIFSFGGEIGVAAACDAYQQTVWIWINVQTLPHILVNTRTLFMFRINVLRPPHIWTKSAAHLGVDYWFGFGTINSFLM